MVFCVVTLVTGSIWGRGSWGVWWTWDARLTLTALLLALFLGYLALRRTGGDPTPGPVGARSPACCAPWSFPIDHYATTWWQTLHQGDTLLRAKPLIHGGQLLTMLCRSWPSGCSFAWLLVHRYRVEVLEDRFETEGLAVALADRRAEGRPADPGPAAPTAPAASRRGHPERRRPPGRMGVAAATSCASGLARLRRARVLRPQPVPVAGSRRGADRDAPGSSRGPAAPRRPRPARGRRLAASACAAAGAGSSALGGDRRRPPAFLLLQGLSNATVYFKTADEAVADKAAARAPASSASRAPCEPGVRQVGQTVTS